MMGSENHIKLIALMFSFLLITSALSSGQACSLSDVRENRKTINSFFQRSLEILGEDGALSQEEIGMIVSEINKMMAKLRTDTYSFFGKPSAEFSRNLLYSLASDSPNNMPSDLKESLLHIIGKLEEGKRSEIGISELKNTLSALSKVENDKAAQLYSSIISLMIKGSEQGTAVSEKVSFKEGQMINVPIAPGVLVKGKVISAEGGKVAVEYYDHPRVDLASLEEGNLVGVRTISGGEEVVLTGTLIKKWGSDLVTVIGVENQISGRRGLGRSLTSVNANMLTIPGSETTLTKMEFSQEELADYNQNILPASPAEAVRRGMLHSFGRDFVETWSINVRSMDLARTDLMRKISSPSDESSIRSIEEAKIHNYVLLQDGSLVFAEKNSAGQDEIGILHNQLAVEKDAAGNVINVNNVVYAGEFRKIGNKLYFDLQSGSFSMLGADAQFDISYGQNKQLLERFVSAVTGLDVEAVENVAGLEAEQIISRRIAEEPVIAEEAEEQPAVEPAQVQEMPPGPAVVPLQAEGAMAMAGMVLGRIAGDALVLMGGRQNMLLNPYVYDPAAFSESFGAPTEERAGIAMKYQAGLERITRAAALGVLPDEADIHLIEQALTELDALIYEDMQASLVENREKSKKIGEQRAVLNFVKSVFAVLNVGEDNLKQIAIDLLKRFYSGEITAEQASSGVWSKISDQTEAQKKKIIASYFHKEEILRQDINSGVSYLPDGSVKINDDLLERISVLVGLTKEDMMRLVEAEVRSKGSEKQGVIDDITKIAEGDVSDIHAQAIRLEQEKRLKELIRKTVKSLEEEKC